MAYVSMFAICVIVFCVMLFSSSDSINSKHELGLYRHDHLYKGDALHGVPNGYGIETYSGDCKYYGEFLNGKKVGFGIMHCPDEDTYSYYKDGGFCTGTSTTRGGVYNANVCNEYMYGKSDEFNNYILHTSFISYRTARRSADTAKHWIDYLSYLGKSTEEKPKTNSHQDNYSDDILIEIYQKIRKSVIKDKLYYMGILGLKNTSDKKAIKKKYKELSLLVHPDKNNKIDYAIANIVLTEVNEAYNFLTKN